MKKYLLSLAVLFAGTAVAQQYKAGDLCYEVQEGVEFLLSKDYMGTTFLTQDSWNYLSTVANDSAKVVFESAGEQTDEGYALYYMKFAATGEYIKDQMLKKGFDGSDLLLYQKPYIFTTTNVEEAAKWTVCPAETRYKLTVEDEDYVANWRVWTNVGNGEDTAEDVEAGIQNKEILDGAIVIMNAHLVEEGNEATYFEYQTPSNETPYVMFAQHGQNSWFFWWPEEMEPFEILETYVLEVLPNGVNYVVGDCPGQYEAESVAAVEAVYARYEALFSGESDEDPLVVLEDLKAAMKNVKVHEMREGYYYIQPNLQVPPGSGKAGLIFDEGGAIRAQEFARPEVLTVEASKYIWYFKPATEADILEAYAEPKENAYYIQNYGTSKWATNVVAKLSGNYEHTFTTGDKAAVYVFEYLSVIPGTVYIYTHQSKGKCTGTDSCPYCAAWCLQNHGKHLILKWNARWDEGNMMFLYPVAQEEVDAIRVQYELNDDGTLTFKGTADGTVRDVVIPSELNGTPVTHIAEGAFKNTGIHSIVIPESVVSVGAGAFEGCTDLRWVDWRSLADANADCFDTPENHGNLLLFVPQESGYGGNVVINGVAETITLVDGKPYNSPYDYTAKTISFAKNFTKQTAIGKSGGWESMVVPFDVEQISFEGKNITPFGAYNSGENLLCWLAEMNGSGEFEMVSSIRADRPLLVAMPNSEEYDSSYIIAGDVVFSATDAQIKATPRPDLSPSQTFVLRGTYEAIEEQSKVYTLNDEIYNVLYEGDCMPGAVFVANERDVRPFEAYVFTSNPQRSATLKIGGVRPTGIETLLDIQYAPDAWYTLQGVRLNKKPVQTGFYIHGGKLEFVRQR